MRKLTQKARLFFLPSSLNEWKPYSLRPKAVFVYVLVAVLIKILSIFLIATVPKTELFATIASNIITDLTNGARLSRGLSLLSESQILKEAASQKAEDMIAKQYFSHASPDGKDPWYWFYKNGYNFKYAGENLAIDFFESGDVVRAWLDSEGHRANILNRNYSEIGVAVVQGNVEGKETTLVVQLFGTPRTQPRLAVAPTLPTASPLAPKESPAVSGPPQVAPETTAVTPESAPSEPEREKVAGLLSLPAQFIQSKPELADKSLNTLADPRWIYYSLLGYLVLAFVLGISSRSHMPDTHIVVGALVAIFVVASMISLPNAETLFGLQARVIP